MASLMPHHDDPHANPHADDTHAPTQQEHQEEHQEEEEEEEEEGEICSICLGTLPRWGGIAWLTCCGKGIHTECFAQFSNSACSQNCPMCRTPTTTSHEESHKRRLGLAKKGKASAMFGVGYDFAHGRGVSESKEMARLWYAKSAEQGHPWAQYNLGVMHATGEGGLPVSREKARLWWETSAKQGHPRAQYNLGVLHANGEGGPVSKEKARLWYEKSAEQGLPDAQYNLGLMHSKGEGGPVSNEHAFFWMTRAGEQGDEQAAAALEAVKSVCFSCGKTGNMKCCARCKCAYYCSRECQAAAWNSGHKAACKQIRRKQQSAN